jgi:hypothetical protein
MLKTLKDLDPKDAEKFLSEVTQKLLPNPGIDSESDRFSELGSQVLEEVYTRLELDKSDSSQWARHKLLKFLVDEMSRYALKDANLQNLKERLGQLGYLRSDLYRIQYKGSWAETEKQGIRRSHVEEAVHKPDATEHLLPERIQQRGNPLISLFMKNATSSRGDRFTLLVQATRIADVQRIDNVWRVYHSDVDLSSIREPLKILRAFVDVYGVSFKVGKSLSSKFFLYEAVPILDKRNKNSVIQIDNVQEANLIASTLFRISSLHVVEIAIAYIIDVKKYFKDLRKHGVQVSED